MVKKEIQSKYNKNFEFIKEIKNLKIENFNLIKSS
jgi:hypothetical protein